jgi:hypothetical protein
LVQLAQLVRKAKPQLSLDQLDQPVQSVQLEQ